MPPDSIHPHVSPQPIAREKAVVKNLFQAVEAASLRDDIEAVSHAIQNYSNFLHTIGMRFQVGLDSPV